MTSVPSPELPALAASETALHRLEQAIDRLELALSTKLAADAEAVQATPSADLFRDEELARARKEYEKLEQGSRQVEARLDDMVDRLQTMLEL